MAEGEIGMKLPQNYQFLKVLGEGSFGKVLQCLQKDTQDIVAVKMPTITNPVDIYWEAKVLKFLMANDLDQHNIVKFFDAFHTHRGIALVLENLDMDLLDYIHQSHPLALSEIRIIVQQVATAMTALKDVDFIHADIKPDNIMLVDHRIRPLRVKLIDFGLAMPKHKIRKGMIVQALHYRSPEILLGLPFSEAIDVWALGCVMAHMILGFSPFPGRDEYETMQYMVELLGQPSDRLLNKGQKENSTIFFDRLEDGKWMFKTPLDYYGPELLPDRKRKYSVLSLDHLKLVHVAKGHFKQREKDHMIELLKAMLQMDEADRITTCQVLSHPFISRDGLNCCIITQVTSVDEACPSEDCKAEAEDAASDPPASVKEDGTTNSQEPDRHTPTPKIQSKAEDSPNVKEDNTMDVEGDHHSPLTPQPRRCVIMVRPAAPEDTATLESESKAEDSPDVKEDNTMDVEGDHHSPLTPQPRRRVIMVRPAAPEDTATLESESKAEDSPDVKEDNTMDVEGDHHSALTPQPRRLVIMVHPAAPEDTATLESESKAEDLPDVKEDNTMDIEGDHHRPSTPPVIMVHPAAPENTVGLGSQENEESLLHKVSETDATAGTHEDSTRTGKSVYDLFTATSSKDQQQQWKEKKKKKNCFRRFCSWMRRNMCSCWTGVDEEKESQR